MSEELSELTVAQLIDRLKIINGILLERKLTESELQELISVAEEMLATAADGMREASKKS